MLFCLYMSYNMQKGTFIYRWTAQARGKFAVLPELSLVHTVYRLRKILGHRQQRFFIQWTEEYVHLRGQNWTVKQRFSWCSLHDGSMAFQGHYFSRANKLMHIWWIQSSTPMCLKRNDIDSLLCILLMASTNMLLISTVFILWHCIFCMSCGTVLVTTTWKINQNKNQ